MGATKRVQPVVGIGTGCPGVFQSKKKDLKATQMRRRVSKSKVVYTCGRKGVTIAEACTTANKPETQGIANFTRKQELLMGMIEHSGIEGVGK